MRLFNWSSVWRIESPTPFDEFKLFLDHAAGSGEAFISHVCIILVVVVLRPPPNTHTVLPGDSSPLSATALPTMPLHPSNCTVRNDWSAPHFDRFPDYLLWDDLSPLFSFSDAKPRCFVTFRQVDSSRSWRWRKTIRIVWSRYLIEFVLCNSSSTQVLWIFDIVVECVQKNVCWTNANLQMLDGTKVWMCVPFCVVEVWKFPFLSCR